MTNRRQSVVFKNTGWRIYFEDCEEIVAALPTAFSGWDLKVTTTTRPANGKQRAIVSRANAGWNWHAFGVPKPREWDSIPPRTPMRVVTDVHDVAIYWYLFSHPEILCIHGAAAEIGRKLIGFPARGRTGKSTLMASLAARGLRIHGDDVIGLKGGQGFALGFAPRLRVPTAPVLTETTRAFITAHSGYADSKWIYLKLPDPQVVRFGTRLPFACNIILRRVDGAKPQLSEARTADVLNDLIAENIIRIKPMQVIFNRLLKLARSCERLCLTYSDPQEAADALLQRFG